MPTTSHLSKRGAIEMEMILEEGRRLRPLLSPDEWKEKQKEFTQRAAVILHRTKQMLEAENAAMDAGLAL